MLHNQIMKIDSCDMEYVNEFINYENINMIVVPSFTIWPDTDICYLYFNNISKYQIDFINLSSKAILVIDTNTVTRVIREIVDLDYISNWNDSMRETLVNFILSNGIAEVAYQYCRTYNIKGNKQLESVIINDVFYATEYAIHVLKDRWIEAEPRIMNCDSGIRYINQLLLHNKRGIFEEVFANGSK